MKKILAVSALVLLGALGLRAQSDRSGTIRGTVVSRENGEALAGANIGVEGTLLGTSSDDHGGFFIRGVPPGSHALLTSLIGFRANRSAGVAVAGGDTSVVKIELDPSPVQTAPLIVTAGRREQSLREVPASVSVIGGELLAERNTITVDDALRYVPGVSVTQSQVNIRGSSGYSFGVGTRVLLLVDGLPFITGDTGEINWESIPASQIERIEVVKGASSALYGSSALGGVINIITKSAGEQAETRLRFYGGLYDLPSYQSWRWTGDARSFSGLHAGSLNRFGGLSMAVAADRTVNDGYRQNDYWRRWNGSARLGYAISPYQSAGLSLSFLEQKRGNFLYWRDFEHAFEPPADQLLQWVYSVRWNLSGSFRQVVSERLFYSAKVSWFRSRWNDNISSRYDSSGSNSRSGVVTGELQSNYQLSSDQFLIAGLSGSFQDVDADTIFGTHDGYGAAAYLQDEISLSGTLRLTAGARFDAQRISGLEAVSQFNPKLGVTYSPSDSSSLRFSVGRGFRAPTVAEVYTTSTAGGVAILPNPDLKPERSWSVEGGVSHLFGGSLQGDLSLFRNEFWDLIEPAFGSDGVVHFQNITRALIYGAECTINLALLNRLIDNQISYTYMVPRDLTTGDVLKYRPRHLLYLSTRLTVTPVRVGIDARFLSNSERIDDSFVTLGIIPGGDHRVPITVVDLRIGADWSLGTLPFTSSLHVNNLFQYYYVELIGNMAPTRNYVLTLETRI
jgi:outer membrane receptor for ferrienterochelin and colicins